jgi:hypothetical protein
MSAIKHRCSVIEQISALTMKRAAHAAKRYSVRQFFRGGVPLDEYMIHIDPLTYTHAPQVWARRVNFLTIFSPIWILDLLTRRCTACTRDCCHAAILNQIDIKRIIDLEFKMGELAAVWCDHHERYIGPKVELWIRQILAGPVRPAPTLSEYHSHMKSPKICQQHATCLPAELAELSCGELLCVDYEREGLCEFCAIEGRYAEK